MCDLLLALDSPGSLLQVLDYSLHCQVDAPSEIHGVHASGHGLAAFTEDSTRKYSRGGGTISGGVVGFVSHLIIYLIFK